MCFIGVHSGAEPLGHRFEGFVLVVEGGLGVYVHNVRHRVDGGPHGIGSDASVVEVLYPFWGHQKAIFVGNSGIGGAAVVIGFEPFRTGVHVVRYFELLFESVFELLDAGLLLVFLGESFNVSFLKGGHQASYDGPKHVSGESIELVGTGLGRSR